GESYRLKQSKARRRRDPRPPDEVAAAADPETGEMPEFSQSATSVAVHAAADIKFASIWLWAARF
ncbi:MAG: hypothetical protein WA624_13740, partial [Methylocella sp.]